MHSPHTLTWGNTHSLVFRERGSGLKATLIIRKPNGKQNLPLTLLPPITIDVIKEAWAAQGEQWDEIVLCQQPMFIARRVIWLPTCAIVWDVHHLADAPYDSFGSVELTRATWLAHFPQKILLAPAVS